MGDDQLDLEIALKVGDFRERLGKGIRAKEGEETNATRLQ